MNLRQAAHDMRTRHHAERVANLREGRVQRAARIEGKRLHETIDWRADHEYDLVLLAYDREN